MRYIRYLCIFIFAVAIVSIALANRQMVSLKMLPDELPLAFAVNPQVELPLFVVILGAVLVGLLLGFVWEWIREFGIRSDAAKQAREKRKLEREVARLKAQQHEGEDDVLALLDKTT